MTDEAPEVPRQLARRRALLTARRRRRLFRPEPLPLGEMGPPEPIGEQSVRVAVKRRPGVVESIVCWLWSGTNLSRREFLPENVNTLARSIARHSGDRFRFVVITDDPRGYAPGVDV